MLKVQSCLAASLLLCPRSSAEAHAGPHLLCPHAFRFGSGQRRRTERGSVEGAGAWAPPAAPERLLEERPGPSPE